MIFVYRKSLKLTLKGFGVSFTAQGTGHSPESEAKSSTVTQPLNGNKIVASGERSVAIGGNMTGSVNTGSKQE